MAKHSDSETLRVLADIEAIKKMKHRYLRCLDCKLWDEITECLTDDIRASFYGGKLTCQGLDDLLRFFKIGLADTRISTHTGHHPEIEVTSDSTAKGTWEVQTYLIDTQANVSLGGVSVFNEDYVKLNGIWKIQSMSCYRIYEETWSRDDIQSLKLTQVMHFPLPE